MRLRFRFRLATLFALISVIALGLAFCQRYMRVPMRTGAAYVGVCYASDWGKLSSSPATGMSSDFETRIFNATEPGDLLKDFSTKPQLWCVNILDEVGRYAVARKSFLAAALLRSRPADRPVEGRSGASDFSHDVMDFFGVVGTFEEARLPPRRLMIDCCIDSRTS